ncbi:hypothetical protein ACFQ4L_02705 [Lapidilactobacillus mulanensis]|uniref:Uncharacterized protein n=1 Tax=Lapidilactobacillus mulanensis TaxID=2485999 RepID=A0ABW4DMG3_9LACO|nr:hypothetical protein [Lapidilactobacillus mulanensis]
MSEDLLYALYRLQNSLAETGHDQEFVDDLERCIETEDRAMTIDTVRNIKLQHGYTGRYNRKLQVINDLL